MLSHHAGPWKTTASKTASKMVARTGILSKMTAKRNFYAFPCDGTNQVKFMATLNSKVISGTPPPQGENAHHIKQNETGAQLSRSF